MLTTTQKIRQRLTGDPDGIPSWQHAGPDVVRWITGGTLPDLRVRFLSDGQEITVLCITCSERLGTLPLDFNPAQTAPALATMRRDHRCRD